MLEKLASLTGDADRLFAGLAHELASEGRFHELFELRLIESRRRLGMPLDRGGRLDDLKEPLRSQLEQAYVDACREVGSLMLQDKRYGEAWMYLRPAGEKQLVRAALERAMPDPDTRDELIHIALFEAVAVERGMGWALGHYGTCQCITMLDQVSPSLSLADQRACAGVLLRHLHKELLSSVCSHIEQVEGALPASRSLSELIGERPWLFEKGAYHVDPSHLAATVRMARAVAKPDLLALALDLTEYGCHLGGDLQEIGEPPFADFYPSHRLFFSALLGGRADEAMEHFKAEAEREAVPDDGTEAIETYLDLLVRLKRPGEALAAYANLVPPGVTLSRHAPCLLQLARDSGQWERYLDITRQRDDAIGYVLGKLEAGRGG